MTKSIKFSLVSGIFAAMILYGFAAISKFNQDLSAGIIMIACGMTTYIVGTRD